IKLSQDKDMGQELMECNRRLAELRGELAAFLSQSAAAHVYWVERAGKTQRNLALNAAPIDVADFLRRRLFGSDTSVLMTSATLAMSAGHGASSNLKIASSAQAPARPPATLNTPLGYFATRVGAEGARLLQVGSPFDYEQQMKSFVVNKMPDPREAGYCDALIRWIEHFVKMSH